MNTYLLAAAVLMGLIGAVHSVLGEVLIFRQLRRLGTSAVRNATALSPRQVGILWASWHAVTLFGWALAVLLWWVAARDTAIPTHALVLHLSAAASGFAALLVLVGTRGRHPGWLGLLVVCVLILLA